MLHTWTKLDVGVHTGGGGGGGGGGVNLGYPPSD